MQSKVYDNLERLRLMMATKSTTEVKPDVVGGGGVDYKGLAEGYIAYAMHNAPREAVFDRRLYKFAVDAYVGLLSSNDYRLMVNKCQRYTLRMMGDKKRQYRHRAAIVRIALHQVFVGRLTDRQCAEKLHNGGVSRQVYAETYKPYVTELMEQIGAYLAVADELVAKAHEIDKLAYLN